VPVSGTSFFLLTSHWTTQCMAVPGYPSNGTGVVQLPCNINDSRQYWSLEDMPGDGWHVVGLQGGLCLDKDQGNGTQGLQIQMWKCNSIPSDWNPFDDQHFEQYWHFIG